MPNRSTYILTALLSLLLCLQPTLNAQVTYVMQNALIDDCEGTLTDSDMGPEEGQYDHNENYVFTICVEGANEIVFTFDFFATEDNYDILTIYDGPDTNSMQIGQFSGTIQPPPVVIAQSGCITFHFRSDDNIVASGWSGSWDIEVDEPVAPEFNMISPPDCPLSSALFEFDRPVDCDLFDEQNFTILGPGGPSIASVNVTDCDPNTGLGQTFELVFDEELGQEGDFRIIFEGEIQDACGEWHTVSNNLTFTLMNCPIDVEIEVVEEACAGECGTVRAIVTGSSSTDLSFQWSHTPLDAEEVEVCTGDSLDITVTVTNNANGETASDDHTYVALENPVILNPLSGDTVCSSTADHIYSVSLSGGRFYSGLIPPGQRESGRYQFWRWSWRNTIDRDTIFYVAPNGCVVRDTTFISPVWAGSIEAVCLNSGSFDLSGETPAGGSWSGPHVDPNGIFTPSTAGSFVVAYESIYGCRDWKRVNVSDSIEMPDVDTICGFNAFEFQAEPFGGRWSGPGIVNDINGRTEVWRVNPQDTTYTYIYELNGCSDSIDVYIYDLRVGPDRTVCDQDSLLFLPNVPGTWTGDGVYIDSINAYDISMLGPGEYYYELNDGVCTDEFYLDIVAVEVEEERALEFCDLDQWILLDDYLNVNPSSGSFVGAGIRDTLGGWHFNPSAAGPGMHSISYDALGCSYNIDLYVEGAADIPVYEFCERSSALQLTAVPAGGTWSGPGILDANSGLFDPQSLGVGIYEISYTAPSGCVTLDTIEIFLYEEVDISSLDQQYCFGDTVIDFQVQPGGGTLTIDGVNSTPSFNPSVLGTGNHEVFYTRGSGECASSERVFFSILAPISGTVRAQPDSICSGQNVVISIEPEGGIGTLNPTWDQGLGFGNSHIVNPQNTTTYRVNVNDGCSDDLNDSVRVFVYPPFEIDVLSGEPVCFDDSTQAEIVTPNTEDYEVIWEVDPVFTGPVYFGNPGIYPVLVRELFSGCEQMYDVELPGAAPLRSHFNLIPNQDCIDIIANEVEIIDLSTGGTNGWMDFGDGSPTQSLGGGVIRHAYQDSGEYRITQIVENELGCRDSSSRWICVNNKVRIFMPNIFTPNDDDRNDVYEITAFGITDVVWGIYDRYGTLVYESHSLLDSWDGTHRGKKAMPGVYVCRIEFRNAATGERGAEWTSVTLLR